MAEPARDAEPKTGGSNPLRVLRNRNFARLYFAGAASTAGYAVGQVAVSWLVYSTTKSAIDVAFVGISFFLAVVFFSLVAGTLVDREERRRLMIISDVVRCATLAAATAALYLFGFNLILLLLLVFVLSAFTTVFQPAERALTPTLIGKGEVADANGLTQMTASLAQFVANGAGGILIATVGALAALGLNSLTFLASAFLLATIVIRKAATAETAPAKPKAGFLDDAKEGFSYIGSHKGLLHITLMAGIGNVFFSIVGTFFVVYSSEVLKGNASVYGVLLALFSLGIGPGSLIVGRIGAIRWAGKAWIGCSVAEGVTMLVLVYEPVAAVAYLCAFVIGFLLGFVNTTWLTTVQLTVPSEMQGRYFGVDQLGSFATIPLGQILGGYVIATYSVQLAYTISGFGMLLTALVFVFSGSLRAWGYRQSDAVVEEVPGGARGT
jgi:MFS transporter, DHA3 family, macrolide efflux protein